MGADNHPTADVSTEDSARSFTYDQGSPHDRYMWGLYAAAKRSGAI